MSNGYGQLNWSRKIGPVLVHRLAYAIEHRVPLESLEHKVVMHSCNNPACIRPSHLSLGTQRDNLAFMRSLGRSARGERSGSTTLTEADVRLIRKLWDERNMTGSEIAKQFGISVSAVSSIAHRINWRHVE